MNRPFFIKDVPEKDPMDKVPYKDFLP